MSTEDTEPNTLSCSVSSGSVLRALCECDHTLASFTCDFFGLGSVTPVGRWPGFGGLTQTIAVWMAATSRGMP